MAGDLQASSSFALSEPHHCLLSRPGYIAGVTNPRFEELRCWDLLCNVETGRITVHKDIEVAPRLALTQNQISPASTALGGGIASASGSYGLTNHKTTLSGDAASDTSMAWSDGPGAGSGRSRGASTLGKSRGAAVVGEFGALAGGIVGGAGDPRLESADSTFMEEVSQLGGILLGDTGHTDGP